MFRFRNILLFCLLFGLIVFESISSGLFPSHSAQSQHQLSQKEQSAILSILQHGLGGSAPQTTYDPTSDFPSFSNPANPGEVAGDTILSYGLISGTATGNPSVSTYTPASGVSTTSPLQDAVPPTGTALYYAYDDGGQFWYGQGNNILVIFPDESILSFNKKTGAKTTWLQDKLAFPPVTDADAYTNYQKNYRAEIVAETSTWVLMEFPSKAVVKVAKPQAKTAPLSSQATIYGLPSNY